MVRRQQSRVRRVHSASIVAVLALLGFLRYESRRNDPFIDLRFFHGIPFASATVIAVCAYAGYGAFLFMMSLYLQVRGTTRLSTPA